MNIDAKIKEADTYCKMGLFEESLIIYRKILTEVPALDPESRAIIQEKIEEVEKTIKNLEVEEPKDVSDGQLTAIREMFGGDEEGDAIKESASAFRFLGLFKEAISEYEKLVTLDYPLDRFIPEMVESLLKIHPAAKIHKYVDNLLKSTDIDKFRKAQVQFRIGMEMEKREHVDIALEFYQSAQKSDPKNKEIKNRYDELMAQFSGGSRYDYLINRKLVTPTQLQQALHISKKRNKSVESILIEHFHVNKEEVCKSLSFYYRCPYMVFKSDYDPPYELLTGLKKNFLLQELWVPMSWDKDGVNILIEDPRNLQKTDSIKALIKAKKLNYIVGIKEDIEEYIKSFFDEKKQENLENKETSAEDDFDLLPDISFEEEEESEEEDEGFDEVSSQIVRFVDQILVAAYRRNTSDIHIEPSPIIKKTSIRFRIDGVCHEYTQVPNSMARGIISRIKIMAGLDISERRLPQDGKIKFKRKGIPPFELRVATLPTVGGYEDAVLRILAKAGAMKLDDMGFNERNLREIKKIITQPYGLVLVVGPTGSGKTTTLHAALGYINKPGIKIWTAEDPVEITQPGLRQVEARPKIGLDFARIMRAFLRADPDVIMIGEMRDHETASIGIEASLTGHLVLSTLHTNSAPETVTRLLDMGLNPLNFSDAFLGVLAQRLVRRLCSNCKEEYHPSEEEFEELVRDYGNEEFSKTGIEYTRDLILYKPSGCEQCSNTGYRGRLGIHELMMGTKEIKKLIKKQATTEDLFKQAIEDGMTTLKQDGIVKVFQGLTDISEIRRVCVE